MQLSKLSKRDEKKIRALMKFYSMSDVEQAFSVMTRKLVMELAESIYNGGQVNGSIQGLDQINKEYCK
jgi:hypothetical protein